MGKAISILLFALAVAPAQARALDLVRAFAECTGRYSALMEHQWLMSAEGSEHTQTRRNQFADLVDAVRAPDQGRIVLSWRIEAKVAQAALFHARAFGRDARLRQIADDRATAEIAACDMLLLQG